MAQQGVYRTFTKPFQLRLTEDQLERTEKAARYRSKNTSDFMRDAIMALVVEVEEEKASRRRTRQDEEDRAFIPRNASRPRGLNLPSRDSPKVEVAPTPAPAQTTVVIQTAPAAAIGRDELAIFVDHILSARNTVDFEARKRDALRMLLSAKVPKEEQDKLARLLEEKTKDWKPSVAAPTAPPKTGWGILGGLGR